MKALKKITALILSLIMAGAAAAPAYAEQKTKAENDVDPGAAASDKNTFLFGGAEHYLSFEWTAFIKKDDGKCYSLIDPIKTVEKEGYRIKEDLREYPAVASLMKNGISLGRLKFTSGALKKELDIRNEYFDKADIYKNDNTNEYYLTVITSEPVCHVGKTAVYLAADAAKDNTKGWRTIDGKQYYFTSDGNYITKNTVIDGVRYKFGKDGACTGRYTGLTKSSKGSRYWKNGELVKNKQIKFKDGTQYYAGKDGYITKTENDEYTDKQLFETKQLISERRNELNIGVSTDSKKKRVIVTTEKATPELKKFINSLEYSGCVIIEEKKLTNIDD